VLLTAPPPHRRVVLIHEHEDKLAYEKIVRELATALGEQSTVEAVDGASTALAVVAGNSSGGGIVAVVCASDPATAATLVWELAEPRMQATALVLVVLVSTSRLETLPKRLRESIEYIALEERGIAGVLSRIEKLIHAPRSIDVLASVFRSAIARRSPDALLAVNSVVGPVIEVNSSELTVTARVGDGGRRPNPLWSHWVVHGRTLELVDPAASKKQPLKRKH
jgi:hypothetical protein